MDVDVKIVDGAAAVAAGEVTAATLGGTLGWDSALFCCNRYGLSDVY